MSTSMTSRTAQIFWMYYHCISVEFRSAGGCPPGNDNSWECWNAPQKPERELLEQQQILCVSDFKTEASDCVHATKQCTPEMVESETISMCPKGSGWSTSRCDAHAGTHPLQSKIGSHCENYHLKAPETTLSQPATARNNLEPTMSNPKASPIRPHNGPKNDHKPWRNGGKTRTKQRHSDGSTVWHSVKTFPGHFQVFFWGHFQGGVAAASRSSWGPGLGIAISQTGEQGEGVKLTPRLAGRQADSWSDWDR